MVDLRYEVKLLRACLFDLNRENDVSDTTFLKSVYLEKVQDQYRKMTRIFEDNICRKVMGDETKYVGTKGSRKAAVEITTNRSFVGRKPTAYYSKIIIDYVKKEYQEALDCTNEDDFRKACSKVANRFAEGLRYPKGIICFLQFTFQLSRKDIQKFLAILNTDYKTDIVQYQTGTEEILDYLTKVFEDDFKYTIIYPYIKQEILSKTKIVEKGIVSEKIETHLKVDTDQLKIHIKPNSDPLIYKVAGTKEPINIQEKLEKTFERSKSDIKSIKSLQEQLPSEFEHAEFLIHVGDKIKFKVNAKEFSDNIRLIVTSYGEGLVFKGGEVKVLLGKKDLFSEGVIKKLDPSDLK